MTAKALLWTPPLVAVIERGQFMTPVLQTAMKFPCLLVSGRRTFGCEDDQLVLLKFVTSCPLLSLIVAMATN